MTVEDMQREIDRLNKELATADKTIEEVALLVDLDAMANDETVIAHVAGLKTAVDELTAEVERQTKLISVLSAGLDAWKKIQQETLQELEELEAEVERQARQIRLYAWASKAKLFERAIDSLTAERDYWQKLQQKTRQEVEELKAERNGWHGLYIDAAAERDRYRSVLGGIDAAMEVYRIIPTDSSVIHEALQDIQKTLSKLDR